MTESGSPGTALEGGPPGHDPGRVSLVVSISVLVVIVVVAVGLFLIAIAQGSESTSANGPSCDPEAGICIQTYRLKGQSDKLPTTDEFAASMAINDRIVFEWHRSGTGALSMPVTQGYEGFLLQS